MIELFKPPDALITSETERYLAGVDSDTNGTSLLFESIDERPDYKPSQDFLQHYEPNSRIVHIQP